MPLVWQAVWVVGVELREKVQVGDDNVKAMGIKMDNVSQVEKRNEA